MVFAHDAGESRQALAVHEVDVGVVQEGEVERSVVSEVGDSHLARRAVLAGEGRFVGGAAVVESLGFLLVIMLLLSLGVV